jgi:cystathionine beta-synthase
LNRVTKEIDALILAKVETFNPEFNQRPNGAKMIDAEADGRLQPGGTIIEGTWKHWNGISACSNY